MSRILIDGRFVGVGESMTRYTLEVLRGVLAMDSKNKYTLLIRPVGEKMLEDYPEIVGAQNLKVDVLDIPHYSLPEQTKLLQYLDQENFDLVHFIQFNHPFRYKKPFVVTVHDLTMVGYLHRSSLVKRVAFGKVMKSAVFDAKQIITISDNARKEIVDFYHVDPSKIEVIYNGIDHARYNGWIADKESRIKKFKTGHKIVGDYLLYTGAWKKHKNLVRLLKAYDKYLNSSLSYNLINGKLELILGSFPQLVLAGKIDDREPEVKAEIERINSVASPMLTAPNPLVQRVNFPLSENSTAEDIVEYKPVVTTGYIEESDLPVAYAGALAYVIPSLAEGFGLPPLESMACGRPVISSNESSMPEILGDAAYYFDPYNIDDIAKAIGAVVNDKQLRDKLIELGFKQASKYSWSETAQRTLKVYRKVLN